MPFPLATGAIAIDQVAAIVAIVAAVVGYEALGRVRGEETDLGGVFEAGASAIGFVIGLRIIALCCTKGDLGPFEGDDRIYIVLGGLALVWLAAQQYRSLLWPKPEDS